MALPRLMGQSLLSAASLSSGRHHWESLGSHRISSGAVELATRLLPPRSPATGERKKRRFRDYGMQEYIVTFYLAHTDITNWP